MSDTARRAPGGADTQVDNAAGMAMAAIVAIAVTGRYGLLAALIASQAAGLVGFAGMFPWRPSTGASRPWPRCVECVPGVPT